MALCWREFDDVAGVIIRNPTDAEVLRAAAEVLRRRAPSVADDVDRAEHEHGVEALSLWADELDKEPHGR